MASPNRESTIAAVAAGTVVAGLVAYGYVPALEYYVTKGLPMPHCRRLTSGRMLVHLSRHMGLQGLQQREDKAVGCRSRFINLSDREQCRRATTLQAVRKSLVYYLVLSVLTLFQRLRGRCDRTLATLQPSYSN